MTNRPPCYRITKCYRRLANQPICGNYAAYPVVMLPKALADVMLLADVIASKFNESIYHKQNNCYQINIIVTASSDNANYYMEYNN